MNYQILHHPETSTPLIYKESFCDEIFSVVGVTLPRCHMWELGI